MKETINVKGMMCEGCEKRVNAALSKLEGVTSTNASATKHQVDIEFDEQIVALDDIKETIEEVGYDIA